MSVRAAFNDSWRASERVRMVANWSMKPVRENEAIVPERAVTMVPAGSRTRRTFRFGSVSNRSASVSSSTEGAQSATGTPCDSTNETALLELPD